MRSVADRLAWELEVERGHSALFGARIDSDQDLQDLMPVLGECGLLAVSLGAEASRVLMLDVIHGRATFPDADTIILTDALASLPPQERAGANLSREVWLSTRRSFLFAERMAGSPETLAELRDLVAVFRDIVDLRADVGREDHLWDTGAAASLEILGSRIPVATRGSTLIIRGRVRSKQLPMARCPDCGGELQAATVSVRFEHAPAGTATQVVPGYRCACGSQWPEPSVMRDAHADAFELPRR